MASMMEIMQHCRLCLVKEQVNVPIFEEHGDIRQIFLKITACLPVKVDREDNLPKKICDGCLYKLDLLYDFWNTSSNAEKQLLSWLSAAGLESKAKIDEDLMVTPTEIVLKEEPITDMPNDIPNDMPPHDDLPKDQNFMKQQSPFETVDFAFGDTNYQDTPETITTTELAPSEGEPEAKRPRRAAAASAAAITAADLANSESEEDVDDPADQTVAKTEDESEEDEDEEIDDDLDMAEVEPAFVDVSQEANPDAQPGPSGIGKTGDAQNVYICEVDDKSHELEEHQFFQEKKPTLAKQPPFKCKICQKQLSTAYTLQSHMKLHTNESMFECDSCDARYSNKSRLLRHVDSVHKGIRFDCSECGKKFIQSRSLEVHMRNHNNEKPFGCKICGKSFVLNHALNLHVKKHTKEKTCQICMKVFRQAKSLINHVNKHKIQKGEDKLPCQICGRKISRKSLRIHMRNHSDEKPFGCITCGKSFVTDYGLTLHIKRHSDERFTCEICSKVFRQEAYLINHKKKHDPLYNEAEEKKLKCHICRKHFTYKSELDRHVQGHVNDKPFPCEICGKTFLRKESHTVHVATHASDRKKFNCQECSKSFVTKRGIIAHIKTHAVK